MNLKFTANQVTQTFDDGIHTLGFMDDSKEPQTYFLLQLGTEFDEQDKKLGQDTYYVEVVDEDQVSGYGGVKSVHVSFSKILFEFEETATWRDDLTSVCINYQITDKNFDVLKKTLQDIFFATPEILTID